MRVAIGCIVFAFLCAVAFLLLNGAEAQPPRAEMLEVGTQALTCASIAALLWIFWRHETAEAAQLGEVVRANIATILLALFLTGTSAFWALWQKLLAPALGLHAGV